MKYEKQIKLLKKLGEKKKDLDRKAKEKWTSWKNSNEKESPSKK